MEKTGWLKNFVFHYGMTRSEREEILLDWNELADKYGMSLLSSPFILSFHSFSKSAIIVVERKLSLIKDGYLIETWHPYSVIF